MHTVRALVVYESMFGNTEQVAGAVARGLRLEGVDTGLVDVGSAPSEVDIDVDLLVLGGPTHAFGMSRDTTRQDAVAKGAAPERARTGLREWLASVRIATAHPPQVAAFDTRVTKVRWLPQAAGPSAARAARRRGLDVVTKPIGFLVDDISGPLVEHELERAVAWGRGLGVLLVDREAASVSQSD
jgi:hypothetical protein